ncbi:MAG: hypothetical protein P8Y81_08280, partial [Ignavibacteriaceae bacterium]
MSSIKTLYYKWRPKLIIGISLILIAIAVLNIYYVVEVHVTSNDECLWIPKKAGKDSVAIFFDVVKVEGVTWNAGIRNGDQLIAIDGKNLESTFQAQDILNEFNRGDYADYTYERNGEIFKTKVYVKKLIQFGNLASTLSALFWMLIGFIVLTAKPDGRVHRLFYLIGMLAVLAALRVIAPPFGDFHKFFVDSGIIAFIVGYLWMISISFIPFVMNYFFWNFPEPFKFAQKKWV